MNIVICDAQKNIRGMVRKFVELSDGKERVLKFDTVSDLLSYLEEERGTKERLFLDIDLGAQMDVGVAARLRRSSRGKEADRKIAVMVNGSMVSVREREIYYIESVDRKVKLHFAKECMEFYGRISDMEKETGKSFYRVHRSFVVNMEHISDCTRAGAILQNGECVPISKYKYQGFIQSYRDFISESRV